MKRLKFRLALKLNRHLIKISEAAVLIKETAGTCQPR